MSSLLFSAFSAYICMVSRPYSDKGGERSAGQPAVKARGASRVE
ncbi:hypothetical protein [Bacteroides pyogenes]|nr:hypothetical protein [Bacteroides pyogenes]